MEDKNLSDSYCLYAANPLNPFSLSSSQRQREKTVLSVLSVSKVNRAVKNLWLWKKKTMEYSIVKEP
jgi:hypothetical protein